MIDYDDDYPTCLETWATIRIFSDELTPSEISSALGVEANQSFLEGELRSKRASPKKRYFETNGWFFCTETLSKSRDCRRHLDIVIERVLRNSSAVATLQERGCQMDITIFYSYTQGGPTLSPKQMSALANANLDLWWDLYRSSEDDPGT